MTDATGILAKDPLHSRLMNLLVVIVLVAYAVATMTLFWKSPYLLAILLLPSSAILIARLGRSAPAIALSGAIIGPTAEALCVAGGLWTYADTGGLPLIPLWLLPLWACFSVALWLIVASILGKMPSARLGTLPLALAGMILEIFLFAILGENTLLAIVAALPLAAAIIIIRPEKTTLILMAAGGILGPVAEYIPMASGAWHYAYPQVMGLPIWLPLAYAMFSALAGYASHAATLQGNDILWKTRHELEALQNPQKFNKLKTK